MMACPMERVERTMIGAQALASTWRTIMRLVGWPMARAASMYSFSLMESTEPRTMRAKAGM